MSRSSPNKYGLKGQGELIIKDSQVPLTRQRKRAIAFKIAMAHVNKNAAQDERVDRKARAREITTREWKTLRQVR